MTVVAAKKIVAVLIMKAVLLGAPIEPGMEVPAGGYAMASWGKVVAYDYGGHESMRVRGVQVLHDADAGLIVAVGPDGDTLRALFAPPGFEVDVHETVQDQALQVPWPPVTLQLPWPKEGSAYYLEEIEPDLFRRTELATTEGYQVSATRHGQDAVEVELELTRRSFTGGDYEDSLDAWTERPLAVRSVVSTTVPLTEERPTLVVWRSPLQPTGGPSLQTGAAPVAGPPPDWAVGTWRLETQQQGSGDIVPMIVHADGRGVISPDDAAMQIRVDAGGNVSGEMADGEATITLTGTLRPDGTGSGRLVARGLGEIEQMTWTATRATGGVPTGMPGAASAGPAAGPPPEWAVGTWLVTAEGIEARVTIHENGEGVIPFPNLPAHIRVDASGRVSTGEQLLPDVTVTVTGALSADGTGSGILCGSHGDEQAQVQWSATKVSDPIPDDDQASAASSAPIRLAQLGGTGGYGRSSSFGGSGASAFGSFEAASPGGPNENLRPMGLAVLLELRRWVYEPASQEMRREFEPLARALEQATDGRASLDLQQTQTPSPEHLCVVPVTGTDEVFTVADGQYRPIIALWLSDVGMFRNWREDLRGFRYLRILAAPSLIAESVSEPRQIAVFAADEDGGFVTVEQPHRGGGGGFEMPPEPATPTPGAPELPFAELLGISSPGQPFPLGSVLGAHFRVWMQVREGAGAWTSIELTVHDEEAAGSGGTSTGASSGAGRGGGSLTVGIPNREVASLPPSVRPTNVDVRNMVLGDVIRAIGRAGDINIIVSPGVDRDRVIEQFTMRNATVERILQALLEPLGLEFTRQENVYIIHQPGEELPAPVPAN